MGKLVDNSVLDAALNVVKTTAVTMTVCSAEPANYAGISAVALADVTIDSADYTGPADGDTSGRKLTVDQQTGVNVDSSGTGTHIALDDGSTLLYVTTMTPQALTSGNTATINAWDIEIADPA